MNITIFHLNYFLFLKTIWNMKQMAIKNSEMVDGMYVIKTAAVPSDDLIIVIGTPSGGIPSGNCKYMYVKC